MGVVKRRAEICGSLTLELRKTRWCCGETREKISLAVGRLTNHPPLSRSRTVFAGVLLYTGAILL
jgi:hypothetical protein